MRQVTSGQQQFYDVTAASNGRLLVTEGENSDGGLWEMKPMRQIAVAELLVATSQK